MLERQADENKLCVCVCVHQIRHLIINDFPLCDRAGRSFFTTRCVANYHSFEIKSEAIFPDYRQAQAEIEVQAPLRFHSLSTTHTDTHKQQSEYSQPTVCQRTEEDHYSTNLHTDTC